MAALEHSERQFIYDAKQKKLFLREQATAARRPVRTASPKR